MAEYEHSQMAQEQWAYVRAVIERGTLDKGEVHDMIGCFNVDDIGFHYMTAFDHGYKHGKGECCSEDSV